MKTKLVHKLFCIITVFIIGVSVILINKCNSNKTVYTKQNNILLGNITYNSKAKKSTNGSKQKKPATTKGFQINIDKKVIKSTTNYIIYVNLSRCKIYIYSYLNKKPSLVKTAPCAPGRRLTPTIKGLYKSQRVAVWVHDVKYKCYLKYVTRIYGGYLFHAQPMNSKGQIVSRIMGVPASHGCVRLYTNDAKYIYEKIPTGSTIYIK
ncbi:L,D-transpeptidase [Clostridium oryzae]|uniref:Putative L,D-transpeptidase YciB n=1 Tax=Clostridium oryzae TaxID=1450648 RepID=A0A1V4IWT8_9CLOT|nr:L,D-transpeptidase [Clostridium oryzae]OPJ64416.1 putative L,D-transpeptidase YciB precursor [Clostridium oryzae]